MAVARPAGQLRRLPGGIRRRHEVVAELIHRQQQQGQRLLAQRACALGQRGDGALQQHGLAMAPDMEQALRPGREGTAQQDIVVGTLGESEGCLRALQHTLPPGRGAAHSARRRQLRTDVIGQALGGEPSAGQLDALPEPPGVAA